MSKRASTVRILAGRHAGQLATVTDESDKCVRVKLDGMGTAMLPKSSPVGLRYFEYAPPAFAAADAAGYGGVGGLFSDVPGCRGMGEVPAGASFLHLAAI